MDAIPGHVQQPFFTVPWVLCATPAYVARRGMPQSPSGLERHDLIGFRNTQTGIVHQWRFREPASAGQVRFALEPRVVFDDGETAYQAAASGVGIACVPHYVVAEAFASGAMIELLRAWRDANTTMWIVRRDTRLTPPRVGNVIAFLKSQAARFDCPER